MCARISAMAGRKLSSLKRRSGARSHRPTQRSRSRASNPLKQPKAEPKTKAAPTARAAGNLSAEEMDARNKALLEAKEREEQERIQAEAEAKRLAEEAARAAKEQKLEPEPEPEKPAPPAKAKEEKAPQPVLAPVRHQRGALLVRKQKLRRRVQRGARRTRADTDRAAERRNKQNRDRVRGKLTINNALDDSQRQRSLASLRRHQKRQKKPAGEAHDPQAKIAREIVVPEAITIQELANRMAERGVDVIKFLMSQGQMLKINDVIDADSAQLVAEEFGHMVKRVSEADVEEGFIGEEDETEDLTPRPPIVTVMGHVDHGKTSLLDALREGQCRLGRGRRHHPAYRRLSGRYPMVRRLPLSTPRAMRRLRPCARAAPGVTDLVILVVAADDGVKPQTVEAIHHAKAAGVPMIVAINKIDKPNADPTRVRTDLLQHEVIVESMSGDVLEIEVSATEKTNLDKLLEAILLQAEILELKANPDRAAEGVVVEAKLERGRGPVGTVLLIQRGTLHVGDIIVAGGAWGRVRALINEQG